ncbi:MAG: hypothetical protein GY754_18875 [bacterium]|nr:hypothetical protein [bacterium]
MPLIKKSILIFILIAAATVFFSCSGAADSMELTHWSVLYDRDDSPERVSQKKDWKPVRSLYRLGIPGSAHGRVNYLWLKSEFFTDKEPASYYGIDLGKTRDRDTVYINNRPVGQKSYTRGIEWHQPSHYRIPMGIVQKGKNIILIRLGVYDNFPASVKPGTVSIYSKDAFDRSAFWNDTWYKQVFVWMIAVFTTLMIVHLIFFFFDRKELILLVLAFGFFLYNIVILPLFLVNTGMNIITMREIYSALLPLMIIFKVVSITISSKFDKSGRQAALKKLY